MIKYILQNKFLAKSIFLKDQEIYTTIKHFFKTWKVQIKKKYSRNNFSFLSLAIYSSIVIFLFNMDL